MGAFFSASASASELYTFRGLSTHEYISVYYSLTIIHVKPEYLSVLRKAFDTTLVTCRITCMKICPKCGAEHDGTQSRCRKCYAEWGRKWRKKNRDKAAAACRRWREKNPDKWYQVNRRHDLAVYGMTPESFDAALISQGGGCAICGTKNPGGPGKKFMVDHCHKTNTVRGLLCCHCNSMIGHALDDPSRLIQGAEYLKGGPNLRQSI